MRSDSNQMQAYNYESVEAHHRKEAGLAVRREYTDSRRLVADRRPVDKDSYMSNAKLR